MKISKMLCMSDFLCIINKSEGIFSTKKIQKVPKNNKSQYIFNQKSKKNPCLVK